MKVQLRGKNGKTSMKAVQKELAEKINKMVTRITRDAYLTAGLYKNAQGYPRSEQGGNLGRGNITDVVMIGAIHEFGFGNNPARPWLSSAINNNRTKWRPYIVEALKLKKDAGIDPLPVFTELGRDVVQTIVKDTETNKHGLDANASSTARAKGGNQPMVDTGHLLRQVDFKVRGETNE